MTVEEQEFEERVLIRVKRKFIISGNNNTENDAKRMRERIF